MTSKIMAWLDQNRHRSYPMERDAWRYVVSPDSGLDCVLLDIVLFDSDSRTGAALVVSKIEVKDSTTDVYFRYGDNELKVVLSGGDVSGEGAYECVRCVMDGMGGRPATMSISFSSHAYIKDHVGLGSWNINCPVLESRVVSLTDGFGVDKISTNGSSGILGHASAADATGEVVLEDGYRTSPIVLDGRVLVRVGQRFGHDPCDHNHGSAGAKDCRAPLFFFCGQNAVNSGNITLKGGRGISVKQGGTYTVRPGAHGSKCVGKTIPCIEIVAGQELLDMYNPEE